MWKFELGWKLKDRVSEVEGIAVARDEWLNGCKRYGIQTPGVKEDGSLMPILWVDEEQLIKKSNGIAVTSKPSGGPRPTDQQHREK